jgi:hypothetical protein
MIIISWSPLDFRVIQARPPKATFTLKFFTDAILPHSVTAKPAGDTGRWVVLHMNNASPHCARLIARNLEDNQITPSPHPTFLPDLAPSHFFLFGALKGQLSGRIFESPDKLVEAIREIASAIPQTTLERVLLVWEARLQRCIDANGAYVDYSLRRIIYSLLFLLSVLMLRTSRTPYTSSSNDTLLHMIRGMLSQFPAKHTKDQCRK